MDTVRLDDSPLYASLVESEMRFRTVADCAPVGIWVCDKESQCVWMNRYWIDYSGVRLKDQLGRGWMNVVHEEDKDRAIKTYLDAFKKREKFRVEYRLRQSNGDYRWHVATGNPRFGDRYEFLGYVGISVDVHDTRVAEKSNDELRADLERSNADLTRFASMAAHDLQEPLRKIAVHGKFLKADYADRLDEEGKYFLEIVTESTARLQTLVSDLLEFSRAGEHEKELSAVDTNACLQHALDFLEISLLESNAQVTFDPLPKAMAYDSLLTRLFQNLVGNAIKYRGDRQPVVHIGYEQTRDEVTFSITDNGIGIEPQYFKKIFDAFQRLHPRDEYQGTGIGLAMCKRIVDSFGGRIFVESKPGEGSTFFVALKLADESRLP